MPRLNSRSSTFRRLIGKRTYIITTSRITSGDELKHRKGDGGLALDLRLIRDRYHIRRGLPRKFDNATPEHERCAEALAIKHCYGAGAPVYVADRIGALALAGDIRGVERLRKIAAKLGQLRGRRSLNRIR